MEIEQKDTTFYSDDRGVLITNTRLKVPNTTYAMANVTSVKTDQVNPKYSGALVTVMFGVAMAVFGPAVARSVCGPGGSPYFVGIFGIILIGLGCFWAKILAPEYHLVISTAARETSGLSSTNKTYIEKVVEAINQAMIHRG